jgi:hypothetical protein
VYIKDGEAVPQFYVAENGMIGNMVAVSDII